MSSPFGREVSLVEALLSQPSVSEPSVSSRMDFINGRRSSSRRLTSRWPFNSRGLESRAAFWAPSACLALGQLLGVSAGGFEDREENRV